MKKKETSAYSWGKNKDGELSVGSTKDIFSPAAIRGMKNKQIDWIASGGQHSACIDTEGQLYICGSYLHGKLGIEDLTTISVLVFTPVKVLTGKVVRQVSCGDYHTLCLINDGTVYTWGGTLHKKLGQRSNAGRGANKPGIVTNLQGKHIIYVDCGDFHSVALAYDGKLFSWGGGGSYFNKGQCGHGHTNDIDEPTVIKAFANKEIIKVSCGGYHTLALTSNNELYSFGSGLYGECGFGEFLNTASPRLVVFPWVKKKDDSFGDIVSISGGGHHSIVLTSNGCVFTFGFASHGQLGLHNTTNYCEPQLVSDLRTKMIKAIAAGWNHSLVLSGKGDVWACGYGFFGQLGLGDDESHTVFTHVGALGNKNITKIFAGGNHSWVVIDIDDPIREDYESPSPLPDDLNTSNLSLGKIDPVIINQPSIQSPKSEFLLNVVYSELNYCHRFIYYQLKEASLEIGKARAEEYGHEMYVIETGLQALKIQEDDDIIDEESQETVFHGGQFFYTCALVCDPFKNEPPAVKQNDAKFKEIVEVKKSYQLNANSTETMLSEWVRFFMAKVGNFCKSPPFFYELRPFVFYNEFN